MSAPAAPIWPAEIGQLPTRRRPARSVWPITLCDAPEENDDRASAVYAELMINFEYSRRAALTQFGRSPEGIYHG